MSTESRSWRKKTPSSARLCARLLTTERNMKRLEQWQIDYIREHRDEYPRKKVAEAIGVSTHTVIVYAMRFGGERRMQGNMPEASRRSISETKKRQHRSEVRRVLAGEKRRYKFPVTTFSKRTRLNVSQLKGRHGYFHAEGDDYLTLCYDEQTRRTSREAYHTEKYGIRFVPADGYKEEQGR